MFHIYIPRGKTLSLVPKSKSSVEVKYQGHCFRKNGCLLGHLCFTNTLFLYYTITTFNDSDRKPYENIWEKKGNLHFLLFPQTFNPFPIKPWFLPVCSIRLLKTLWEKEKLLVTSNFSFSHSIFYQFRKLSTISIS